MQYKGKLFLALLASAAAGAAIGYLLSDKKENDVAGKLAEEVLKSTKESSLEELNKLKKKLHNEANKLAGSVEKVVIG